MKINQVAVSFAFRLGAPWLDVYMLDPDILLASMATLFVTNKHSAEQVYIDARFSDGQKPFGELPSVPGFPRMVSRDEEFSIDMGEWAELLYRAGSCDDVNCKRPTMMYIYRIAMHGRRDIVRGFIWRFPVVKCEFRADAMPSTGFQTAAVSILTTPEGLSYLKKKCGVSDAEILRARNELAAGIPISQIALPGKVRTTKKYDVVPHLKITSHKTTPEFCEVNVTLTDFKRRITVTRRIIETYPFEAFFLLGKFMIKAEHLVLNPGKTMYGIGFASRTRERGYSSPIRIPLTDFFS